MSTDTKASAGAINVEKFFVECECYYELPTLPGELDDAIDCLNDHETEVRLAAIAFAKLCVERALANRETHVAELVKALEKSNRYIEEGLGEKTPRGNAIHQTNQALLRRFKEGQ